MQAIDATWAEAMERGDHLLAWAANSAALAARPPQTRDDPALPYHQRWVWDGTPVDGRDVLVRCYHGLGDTLQFARFLPELLRRAAAVTLEVQPRLACLFEGQGYRVVSFDPAAPLPPGECDIEIMDLSFALRLPPASCAAPWLQVDAFMSLPPGTVGLCLTAGDWDPERSVQADLLHTEPFRRPCLSLDLGGTELPVLNPGGGPADIAATAALVAGCALVVTVDTMIAHLAGCLGIPTFVLLKHTPDWRWGTTGERSEWYPRHRLIRQPEPGDWINVVRQVRRELAL